MKTLLKEKIIQELQNLPKDKLSELYDIIHHFRLGLEQESHPPRTPGLLKGKLGDAFFEPCPKRNSNNGNNGNHLPHHRIKENKPIEELP